MAASPAEALRKAVLAAIDGAPGKTLTYSKLLEKRGVSGANSRELSDALTWRVAGEQIVDVNGKPSPGRGSKFRVPLFE